MLEYLLTPQHSFVWGWLATLAIFALNMILMFNVFLAYFLRARHWLLAVVAFLLYSGFNILFPSPAVRSFRAGDAFPPMDALRLVVLVVGLLTGAYAVWRELRVRGRL